VHDAFIKFIGLQADAIAANAAVDSYYDGKIERLQAGDVFITEAECELLASGADRQLLVSSSGLSSTAPGRAVGAARTLHRDLAGGITADVLRKLKADPELAEASKMGVLNPFARYSTYYYWLPMPPLNFFFFFCRFSC
jgi:hypothetical protein